MRFLGVDPGKHGGVGVLNEDGTIISFDIMRDVQWFAGICKEHASAKEGCQILMEKAQVMAKQGAGTQGAVGMFNYGVHFGELMGALAILKIPYELVPPQTWTKVMHIGTTSSLIPKEKSKVILKRLFPGEDLRNPDAPKSKIMHDGIMDGILIAEFGRRRWKGQL